MTRSRVAHLPSVVLAGLVLVGVVPAQVAVAGGGSSAGASAGAGSWVTPGRFGAVGDGVADDTVAVQRALDSLGVGRTLTIPAGKVYRHTGVLRIRVAGSRVTGPGVLLATNEAQSSVFVAADDVVVDGGLVVRTVGTTRRWDAYEQMGVRVAGVSGTVLRNIKVQGAAAAGVYVGASSGFTLQDVQVSDSRADGIHMTEGSHDGLVVRPVVRRSGDDGVAVVSYSSSGLCRSIVVDAPVVRTTTWGRGLSVVGGEDITYKNVDVDSSNAAAVYVANEGAPYFTYSAKRVSVLGGVLTHANTNPAVAHGAVMVYSAQTGQSVQDVIVQGLTITDTTATAPWTMGVVSHGGSVSHTTLRSIDVRRGSRPFWSNLPGGAYSTLDITSNGRALADHHGS